MVLDNKDKLINGVRKMADAVSSTLGPKGQNVIIQTTFDRPHSTKDGVTVAKAINFKDKEENLGAQILRQAAEKTVSQAGDGTTTAITLARNIIDLADKYVKLGNSATQIRKELYEALEIVVENLKGQSKPIGDRVYDVALISSNYDEAVATLIQAAVEKIGINGVLSVQDSKTAHSYLETTDGMAWDRGFISPYFVNTSKNTVELENVYILLYEKKLRASQEIVGILEQVVNAGGQLLVVADEVEAQALSLLVINKVRAGLNLCAVKTPGFGDQRQKMMQDLAVITGGKYIAENAGDNVFNVKLEDLGRAEKVVITENQTTIIEGHGNQDDIKLRKEQILKEIEEADNSYLKEKAKERYAKLSNGVAVIYVGASTEIELKDKKDRIDDAIRATWSALEEGVVNGGGTALLEASKGLDTKKYGHRVLKEAIKEFIRVLARNSGYNADIVLSELEKKHKPHIFDARNGDIVPASTTFIIDPTKVVRCALENAVSVAALILATSYLVTQETRVEDEYE